MANKIIQLTSDTEQVVNGLEVYRDISLTADLNQANILKSYREIIPLAYLSGKYDDNDACYVQGSISALDYFRKNFNIEMQISDTYYEELYANYSSCQTCLKAEKASNSIETSAIVMEQDKNCQLMLFQNAGDVSAYAEWKESKQWNPYKLAKLVNVKAVFNSLHNIFTWTPGERVLNPEFGTKLRKLLYEGITDFTSEAITAEICRCISEFEPRVSVTSIENVSTTSDTEQNTIQIDIHFTIPSLSREQFVYSYTYNQYDNE